jgi:hypothetical protein
MQSFPTLLQDRSGAISLNRVYQSLKDGILIPSSEGIVVPAATSLTNPGQSPYTTLESPSDAWDELFALIGNFDPASDADAAARMLAMIKDTGTVERRLMNRPVLFNHVFGTVQNPAYIMDSATNIWMEPLQSLIFNFFNPSIAGPATLNYSALCTKFQQPSMNAPKVKDYVGKALKHYRQITPYWFTCDSSVDNTNGQVAGFTIPAGGTVDIFFTSSADVELILTCAYATSIPAAGAVGDTVERFQAQFWDARTDRPMQTQPFTLNTGFGSPAFPHYFSIPIIVPPDYKLRARFKSLITNVSQDVFVTLHGVANYNYAEKYLP